MEPSAFAQFAFARMILDYVRMLDCLAIYPEGRGGATPLPIERYRMAAAAAKIGAAKRPHQRSTTHFIAMPESVGS